MKETYEVSQTQLKVYQLVRDKFRRKQKQGESGEIEHLYNLCRNRLIQKDSPFQLQSYPQFSDKLNSTNRNSSKLLN